MTRPGLVPSESTGRAEISSTDTSRIVEGRRAAPALSVLRRRDGASGGPGLHGALDAAAPWLPSLLVGLLLAWPLLWLFEALWWRRGTRGA